MGVGISGIHGTHGIPMGMGIVSGILMGMGMGMGKDSMGMGKLDFYSASA